MLYEAAEIVLKCCLYFKVSLGDMINLKKDGGRSVFFEFYREFQFII